MPWFSPPQRDSPDNLRAVQQALVYAGYPHSAAAVECKTHLFRLRAALAGPRQIVSAGLVAGAALAAALTFLLGLAGFAMGALAGPGVPTRGQDRGPHVIGSPAGSGTPTGPTASLVDTTVRSLLDVLPAAIMAATILSLAGAGMALVARRHWRRAGVLETFLDVSAGRLYLLEAAAVWLGISVLIVLVVRAQAGPEMADGAVLMLVSVGIPLLVVAFTVAFPGLYRWLLPRLSPLDAAAYARPIIGHEAALHIKAEREAHGRSTYHRTAYDRSVWADKVLARLATSRTPRRRR